jgi:Protein of unknown function (DUF3631)
MTTAMETLPPADDSVERVDDFDSVPLVSEVLLNDLQRFIRRFVVTSDPQADAVTLWTAHTHAIEAADATPYLAVTSAEKRSGKTRLREVLELLVHVALPAANISDAALFRAIEKLTPTLLLDEADAVFKAREREDLRGMLNAGYRRGAVAYRMGGANKTTLEDFPVFCAKAFFGIGDFLPDTLVDRSIPIRLQRRTSDEPVERFRRRDAEAEGLTLRDRLADWLEPQVDELQRARPQLPEELDDRASDSWEPLFAIADLAGGDWPERARRAALTLFNPDQREDDSMTARLLADIYSVFESNGDERLKTTDLIDELCEIEESPWGDWHGKPISAHGLSKLLRSHRIKTMPVWTEGKTVRGYKAEQFDEAWFRVLGVRRVRNVRSESPSQKTPNATNRPNAVTREPASQADLAEALCLVCEARPVVGGPCSLRCTECREATTA